MHLYKMVMQKDSEYTICELFGQRSFAHFLEMNKSQSVFELPYVQQLKRCEDLERRVQFISSQCAFYHVGLTPCDELV